MIDLGKDIEIAVYDYYGNQLNLKYCTEDIIIIKYIGDLEDLEISKAMELAEQGVDIFNAKDSFFNDICHHFKNKNDSDITLKDRRGDIFQNVTFCGDECKYGGIDFELMVVNCICIAETIQITNDEENSGNDVINDNKGITLNDLANSFTSKIFDFNYIVIKCYNLVFNKNILKKNIGFYVLLFMNFSQICFLIIFLIKRLKPIRNYMLVFEPFDPKIDPPNPPKKNKKNENDKIREIFETDCKNNKNLNKKEKEIKKSILINNIIQSDKK